jgi:hypothetical protein
MNDTSVDKSVDSEHAQRRSMKDVIGITMLSVCNSMAKIYDSIEFSDSLNSRMASNSNGLLKKSPD